MPLPLPTAASLTLCGVQDFTNAPLCTFGGTCDFDDETGVFLDNLLAEDATH